MKKKLLILGIILLVIGGVYSAFFASKREFNVLVFSKTASFRHESIEAGKQAIMALGKKHGFGVDTTEYAEIFKEKSLKKYKVVVFLNTTGDVLNDAQQIEMNRFIQAGGGFVGIHAAADTEYDWPWYGALVGAYFNGHPLDPNVRHGVLKVVDKSHESTKHLPDEWPREDEWYNYKDIQPDLQVLIEIDENSYEGGTNGDFHPMAWYHEFDGGRAFYTGLGHTVESYSEPDFLKHLWGGISYAAGDGKAVNYNLSTVAPEENRFSKVVLDDNLFEPMELEILPNGKIIFIERPGNVRIYDPAADSSRIVARIPVFYKLEDGLLGMALDPNYASNQWIYLFYSPPGEAAKQHVSRFVFDQESETLDLDSEKVLLEIPTQRDQCCHSAGSLEFGPDGNLFISTGDNTSPRATGYAPLDEREGRSAWDAQKSSGNTHDLRGKILRIRPEKDGTYSIPEGNLFPKDGSRGRPEIYVMGCRNPYRISIDQHTGYLYWGDVGPDAGEDSTSRGPRGYDEVNQARKPGFFGWPYFVGKNYAYHDYRYPSQKETAPAFDPQKPINESPNNTGQRVLPPAQPAFIWYPYGPSPEFPLVKDGGRNAMAGPVFYAGDYPESEQRFPEYYNGKLFTYDWMRGWIMAITMDEEGNFVRMEPFLPSMTLNNPIDMLFAPDGSLYLLEYGTRWFVQNPDARLVHIAYIAGNRQPVARINADQSIGGKPLRVKFDGSESMDFDGDVLTYQWKFDRDEVQSTEVTPTYTFEQAGKYTVTLLVSDPEGQTAEARTEILVGNALPQISWNLKGNRSFYWDGSSFEYEVKVSDPEDGSLDDGGIKPEQVSVSIDFLERGKDLTHIAQGHQALMEASEAMLGKTLIDQSDCKGCHQMDQSSVGPSYRDISRKYKDDLKALPYLAQKIVKGGGGVWGEVVMAPHPQLSMSEAEQMARYLLSLESEGSLGNTLPVKGRYTTNAHIGKGDEGSYILSAIYTDRGGEVIGPLTAKQTIVLRHSRVPAPDFDEIYKGMVFEVTPDMAPGIDQAFELVICPRDAWLKMAQLDLSGVQALEILGGAMSAFMDGGIVEIRLDDPEGELIGTWTVETSLTPAGMQQPNLVELKPTEGMHDLYLVSKNEGDGNRPVAALLYVEFLNRKPNM